VEFDCLNLGDIIGFDWDEGNINKNENKHGLNYKTIEEVFFNKPLVIAEDYKHSKNEQRCMVFGKLNSGKLITVIFTKRENKIRVISARSMNKKERKFYEKRDS
jgi:uncharacterized DUF497 family protein